MPVIRSHVVVAFHKDVAIEYGILAGLIWNDYLDHLRIRDLYLESKKNFYHNPLETSLFELCCFNLHGLFTPKQIKNAMEKLIKKGEFEREIVYGVTSLDQYQL